MNKCWTVVVTVVTTGKRILAITLVAEVLIIALLVFLAWATPAVPNFSFYPVFAVATPIIWLLRFILGPMAVLVYWITPWRGFWRAAPFNLGIGSLFCAIDLAPKTPFFGAWPLVAVGALNLWLMLKGNALSKRIGLALTLGLIWLDRYPAPTFWAPLVAGVVWLSVWVVLGRCGQRRHVTAPDPQSA